MGYQITAERAELECTDLLLFRRCRMRMYFYLREPQSLDLAFDVFAEADDKEIPLGTIAWSKSETGWAFVAGVFPKDVKVKQIRPVLRGSRDAAAQSVGCFSVWDGELRLRPISVSRK